MSADQPTVMSGMKTSGAELSAGRGGVPARLAWLHARCSGEGRSDELVARIVRVDDVWRGKARVRTRRHSLVHGRVEQIVFAREPVDSIDIDLKPRAALAGEACAAKPQARVRQVGRRAEANSVALDAGGEQTVEHHSIVAHEGGDAVARRVSDIARIVVAIE